MVKKKDGDTRKILSQVLQIVCKELKVTPEAIQSDSRERPLPMAREIFCTIGKELTDTSFDEISLWINKAHSTAKSAVQRCKIYCQNEPEYLRKYNNCMDQYYWGSGFVDLFYLDDEKEIDRWMFLHRPKY